MTTRRISEDAPELALPARGPERPIDVGLRHHEVERAIERLRLRPRPEDPARAIQLPLVELHVLVPQRDHRHPPPSRLLVMYIVYRSMNISSRPTSPTTSSGPWSSGLASARATCRRT